MEIGFVGLGKMGMNMVERLRRDNHQIVAFDLDDAKRKEVSTFGADGVNSLKEMVARLSRPRGVWVMVPAGAPTETTINQLAELLEPGDAIIDGGNTNFHDDVRRAKLLGAKQLHLVDAGTSGGIWGLKEGYSMMVGGDKPTVEYLRPLLETLAPGKDQGWGRVGPSGSGHFVKMVHNGIEYGMMQAYAEGFAILKKKNEFALDMHQISEIWRTGSVVRSWLLDLLSIALKENAEMAGIAPYVSDSGEGRWTVAEAIDLDVPAPVITLSLLQRLTSRDSDSYSDKLLAAMRNQFGGHAIKVAAKK